MVVQNSGEAMAHFAPLPLLWIRLSQHQYFTNNS
jgi:hypothetical protein